MMSLCGEDLRKNATIKQLLSDVCWGDRSGLPDYGYTSMARDI